MEARVTNNTVKPQQVHSEKAGWKSSQVRVSASIFPAPLHLKLYICLSSSSKPNFKPNPKPNLSDFLEKQVVSGEFCATYPSSSLFAAPLNLEF